MVLLGVLQTKLISGYITKEKEILESSGQVTELFMDTFIYQEIIFLYFIYV